MLPSTTKFSGALTFPIVLSKSESHWEEFSQALPSAVAEGLTQLVAFQQFESLNTLRSELLADGAKDKTGRFAERRRWLTNIEVTGSDSWLDVVAQEGGF